MYKIPEFIGPFKEVIPLFINYKRALGYDYGRSTIQKLKEMDTFFFNHGYTTIMMNQEMYDLWLTKRNNEKGSTREKRDVAFRTLAKFLQSRGYKDIQIPERNSRIFQSSFVPYIYSKDEIQKIFVECNTLVNNKINNPKIQSIPAILALLYGSGLRISEVLNITYDNIDLDNSKIEILDSKHHVNRLIIISSSVKEIITKYVELQDKRDGFIFKDTNGKQITDSYVRKIFYKILKKANIYKNKDALRKRLHDFRHSFSVHTLEQMVKNGYDIYTSLPLLSKYLGHKNIVSTEYYLRFTEEAYKDVTKLTNEFYKDVFPKVVSNNDQM